MDMDQIIVGRRWWTALYAMTGDQLVVAMRLIQWARHEPQRLVDTSIRQIATETKVSRPVVDRTIKALNKVGVLLRRTNRKGIALQLRSLAFMMEPPPIIFTDPADADLLMSLDEEPDRVPPRVPPKQSASSQRYEGIPHPAECGVPPNEPRGTRPKTEAEKPKPPQDLRDKEWHGLTQPPEAAPSASRSAPKVAPTDRAVSPVQGSLLPSALTAPGVAAPASPAPKETEGAKRQGRRGATMEGSADKPARRRRRSEMPEGWAPSDKHVAQAKELGVDLVAEREKFTAWSASTGQIYVDWDQAFRNWLLNARERMQRRPGGPASPTDEVPAFVRRPAAVPTAGLLAPAPTRPGR